MMSGNSRFTFPRTLGGQHKITAPKSSDSKQTQNTEWYLYIVQEYNCPHHPSLNTPSILHRTPCPQALLPIAYQTSCANYEQVSQYEKKRGCMDCESLARTDRQPEEAKHPEIVRRMQEMGLSQESIEHFEKVASSFPASRRVLELVKERARREDVREKMESKQESDILPKKDDLELISSASLTSVVEGPVVRQNDSAKAEHKTELAQPTNTKVENTQLETVLEEKSIPQPPNEPTEARNPTTAITPDAQISSDEPATSQLQPADPFEAETPNQSQAASIQLHEIPPPSSLSPEKLTDNVHIQMDEDWDWDDGEPERVFGEVALAPSSNCQTGDEWIVVGSWEQ
ncbi:hypothetical protein BOTCAL_0097g00060 [Botryotinia calthae]|uniref:Uncharacterized protein n=1 Tax=Botryotinia calthae TaxID=38488 RepID=A0A4Y8D8L0_9HELO|nr:hypothetical protein BOTCAL_0097g00060 [Botryotinia calthae]